MPGQIIKKVIISRDIHAVLKQDQTFLNRGDIRIFVAESNDAALSIHRAEHADLIITHLDMPGIPSEQFCSLIREDVSLRAVSMIMVCSNNPEAIKESSRCRANAVLLEPLHPVLLIAKAEQLLFISARQMVRVLLRVGVDSKTGSGSFYCRTRNISATGMLIETDKRLTEGTRLSCQFYLPNAVNIEATGKIIRIIEQAPGSEGYQYGLMFTDLPADTQQLIQDYVEDAQALSSK